jgi:hypothetical protein
MDTIVLQNKIYRFELEYEMTDDVQRRAILKAIIEKLHGKGQNTVDKFNNFLNNILTTQNNKPYHRLNLFQKEQVVKDYVFRTWNKDKVELYTKQIMQLIIDKEIKTPNIIYSIENGRLENIKNISEENGNIVLKQKKPTKETTTEPTKEPTKETTKETTTEPTKKKVVEKKVVEKKVVEKKVEEKKVEETKVVKKTIVSKKK